MTEPVPIVLAFPEPNTPELRRAYNDLKVAEYGSKEARAELGDLKLLPRPWDPPTCTKEPLRRELWQWLEQFVTWFNHEYVWDLNAGMIPPCWPQHPHLVHEIAVLADMRRRAADAVSSAPMEEWHRYGIPAFLDRMKARTGKCGAHDHEDSPARYRHERDTSKAAVAQRQSRFSEDLATLAATNSSQPPPSAAPGRPTLRIVNSEGDRIDPVTGEVLE